MTKRDIYDKLVDPICALEEYEKIGGNTSPIVSTVTIALRAILNEIEGSAIDEESTWDNLAD